MILEDLLILAIAKPVELSDGRLTRCVIGYSDDLKSLVRLYPTYHKSTKVKEGNVLRIPVIRGDSRENTYKIKNSKDLKQADDDIVVVDHMTKREVYKLLKKIPTTTINKLNETKKSMGIIKPTDIKIFQKNGQTRMIYNGGSKHNQQILGNQKKDCTQPLLIVGNHHTYRNSFMVISWKNKVKK